MKGDTFVLHAEDVKKALPRTADKPFAWLYLGQDIKQRESVARVLGKETRYFIGNLLQETARREKQPFLNFIAKLGFRQKNQRHWWASSTAYRSPLVSNFFLMWCYATVFDEVCFHQKMNAGKFFLVLVEDRWLYRHLWQHYKKSGLVFLSRKSIMPELLRLIARGIFSRGVFIKRTLCHIQQQKGIFTRRKVPAAACGQENIYIYPLIRERFFKENGEFESPHLGRLPGIISANNLNVVYVTIIGNGLFLPSATRRLCLNQSKCTFVFLAQYINFWSLIRSSLSVLMVTSFMGSPVKFLLLREMAREFYSFPYRVLEYYAMKRWLSAVEAKNITIIYLFENQPWEKMLCLAARESGKDIKLIGYQHSSVPSMLLNYFLGDGESASMPLPSTIVTNGEYSLNLLKNAGYGETKFANGGAVRYEYFDKIKKVPISENRTPKTILVAMSYSYHITQEMLLSLFDSFIDNSQDLKFLIKFHPEVPLESLPIQPPAWPAHFQKTASPISELLKEANLVIYSASTVGLEALLTGVPVVRYYSEHAIDLDPLDTFDENMIKSCSERDIRQVVMSVLNEGTGHISRTAASGTDINKFFSPVREDVWLQVIKS